jgi:N-acetylglucosaminyldiphosphoundecaprenol N-acetyl-beta-D-mannosaminyltransferase
LKLIGNVNEIKVLGIKIDALSLAEAREKVRIFLSSIGQHTIFTPNPEILVKAQKDEYFKYSLNKSDLNLCDGRGIQFVSKQKIERITGVDFMLEICQIAEMEKKTVYLLGSGSDGVVKKTAENLINKFPNLKVAGWGRGPVIKESDVSIQKFNNSTGLIMDAGENANILENINKAKPDILFVAFGMGKQEKWIIENLAKIPSVKIAMGVGGAFDYISGSVKRAPLLLRKIGLEWLYRLVKQPRRVVRIWNATVKFLWLFFITYEKHS